jgi:DNA polymerase III epsilon subunit family exonuclease
VLEEHHDALSDPRSHDEVVRLAERLSAAQDAGRTIWLERNRGIGIALKGMLGAAGIRASLDRTPPDGAECIVEDDASLLGLPLTVFKALQLMRSEGFVNVFRDFTAIDVETTDKDVTKAEVVEIAAVRVRDGRIVDTFDTLVRPRGRVTAGALAVHGIAPEQLAAAPSFEDVWPAFRDFCGGDVLVAHNGYEFDFRILKRLTGATLPTYDTLPLARSVHPTSAKLPDLARHYGIDPGASHRALDDTRTLAGVCLRLHEEKVTIARKTALANLLDYLGLALALSDTIETEADLLRRVSRTYALGRYSDCLDFYEYEREQLGDPSIPTLHQVIVWLGGEELMQRVRAEKSAKERYPVAMARMRRLLEQCGDGPIAEQIARFLERLALSQSDGAHPDRERVNLLTLHSTKGLEFSRVYILGVEDAQLIGGKRSKTTTPLDLEEARRLLYVGMTRAKDRLVLTHVQARNGQPTGGHRFLDEMALVPTSPQRVGA